MVTVQDPALLDLLKAAETEPLAMNDLGGAYSCGQFGLPVDPVKSFEWFQKAADKPFEHPQACFNLACCYAEGYGVAKSDENALKWYKPAAEGKDVDAMYALANCYAMGKGTTANDKAAAKWYLKAGQFGHVEGAWEYGVRCWVGKGCTQCPYTAAKFFEFAAERGHTEAQFSYGNCYATGEGVPSKNMGTALRWWKRAAAGGHPNAGYNVGVSCVLGNGTRRKEDDAVGYFQRAADWGHAGSALELAKLHDGGKGGLRKDAGEACRLYEAAYNTGQGGDDPSVPAEAAERLGHAYESGTGRRRDDKLAMEWYERAAKLGHVKARTKANGLKERAAQTEKRQTAAVMHNVAWGQFEERVKNAPAKSLSAKDVPVPDAAAIACLLEEEGGAKKLRMRWHPDKFTQKYGQKMKESELAEALKKVGQVMGSLNKEGPLFEVAEAAPRKKSLYERHRESQVKQENDRREAANEYARRKWENSAKRNVGRSAPTPGMGAGDAKRNGNPWPTRPPSAGKDRPPSSTKDRPPSASKDRPSSSTKDRPPSAGRQRPPSADRQRPPSAGRQRPTTERPPSASKQRPPSASKQRPPSASRDRPPLSGNRANVKA